jgi:hypothetical protein
MLKYARLSLISGEDVKRVQVRNQTEKPEPGDPDVAVRYLTEEVSRLITSGSASSLFSASLEMPAASNRASRRALHTTREIMASDWGGGGGGQATDILSFFGEVG